MNIQERKLRVTVAVLVPRTSGMEYYLATLDDSYGRFLVTIQNGGAQVSLNEITLGFKGSLRIFLPVVILCELEGSSTILVPGEAENISDLGWHGLQSGKAAFGKLSIWGFKDADMDEKYCVVIGRESAVAIYEQEGAPIVDPNAFVIESFTERQTPLLLHLFGSGPLLPMVAKACPEFSVA